ncbi:lipoprotein [Spiroplasma endosymbiont of Glossina fuscipes fuscipes]|uniref:lipoprotein n=1 Tax=Spiroplasma endosymbiont of Glossina fuscipes fuscipes TaxID=2004463 RepID=UPI003C76F49F
MKKWLSILGTIGLTATSTTTLISCEKPNNNENGGNKPELPYNPQQPPENSNWKLITSVIGEGNTGKTYIGIFGSKTNWNIIDWKGIEGEGKWHLYEYKSIYRWDGEGEPEIPTVDNKTGKITDWKE